MAIRVEGLVHVYGGAGYAAREALKGVNLAIADGERVAIMGPTGSGKSTLVQHFNGLLRPTRGRVEVDGLDLWAPGRDRDDRLAEARRRVGLVFQFPEQQLFAETVWDDIAFAPRNLGLAEEEVAARVQRAMALAGLDPELAHRSPFSLSGGQMRRVAIAGVLAMMPRTLVLDEPTAGLDPQGRAALVELLDRLHRDAGLTVVLVSHDVDEVAALARRVVLMRDGRVVADGPAGEVLADEALLAECRLRPPATARLLGELARRGLPVNPRRVSLDETEAELLAVAHLLGPVAGGEGRPSAPDGASAPVSGARTRSGDAGTPGGPAGEAGAGDRRAPEESREADPGPAAIPGPPVAEEGGP
ncbi:energy-coupling factor transporter ATPase [Thermaerobacter subterraneus]|uniref:Energy-coupling factor transporter ATP-binding protein EcfA2 n=1 Tax=Thermaerobacter subterraneus DSM 13965 TaxID=867903 RepID=K6Q160_9FIRM|nr:energy-coupling factor transporter ATPase [Thermaerobacter subterraneus]EKP94878.1 cobalt transport protein ATP-binding subunit [Thermaerobacter subterraneus DSM 13965]